MHKPIYSSEAHRAIIEVYIEMCKQFVQDSTTQTRNNNYLEVVDVFFAGIETKGNAATLRAYKVLLDQLLQETVTRLDFLEPQNDWNI